MEIINKSTVSTSSMIVTFLCGYCIRLFPEALQFTSCIISVYNQLLTKDIMLKYATWYFTVNLYIFIFYKVYNQSNIMKKI